MKKALEILKNIRDIETEYDHRKEHRFDEAIAELEALENIDCDNCRFMSDLHIICPIVVEATRRSNLFGKSIEDIQGKQFNCSFWESKE